MLNSHQSEMCANKARQQYTPMGLFFFPFTPIKMKLYTMKVPMTSKTFCIPSCFENEFEYANELYTNRICLLICIGRNTIPLAGTTKPGSFQVRGQSKSSIAITHWQYDDWMKIGPMYLSYI